MVILITGAAGFAAHHFLRLLAAQKVDCKVVCVYHQARLQQSYMGLNIRWEQADLCNQQRVHQLIALHQPTHILHLAAQSSVGKSWQEPHATFDANAMMALHLLEAMRLCNSKAKLVLAGSAEMYAPNVLPVNEDAQIAFANVYAFSKYAQEQLALLYVQQYGLRVVCTRAFNHIGPYQNTNFAIPSFANQIAVQLKAKALHVQLHVGNVDIVRDFTDVRDIVKAYWLLLMHPTKQFAYNVCSGQGKSIASIIQLMSNKITKPIALIADDTRMRSNDNPILIGDASRIQQEFEWSVTVPLAQTIHDILLSEGVSF
jgi:GDP-4-dehydro-6-deoxy-D-mannose reductase